MCLISKKRLVCLVVCSVVWGLAAAPAKAGEGDVKVDVEVELESAFTDNVLHLSEERLREFSQTDGPGQRFDDFESKSDLATSLAAAVDVRRRLAGKRDLSAGISLVYTAHLRNRVRDYLEIELPLSWELTRDDRIKLTGSWIPSRIKKRLKVEVGGADVFRKGDFSQIEVELEWKHHFNKLFSLEVSVAARSREFGGDLSARDLVGYSSSLAGEWKPIKWLTLSLELEVAEIETDTELDGAVEEDRSYRTAEIGPGVEVKVPMGFRIKLGASYRLKDYTTSERLDLTRHRRTDELSVWELEVSRKVASGVVVTLFVEGTRNRSDRDDPNSESDEEGYEETTFGFSVSAEF